MWQRAVARSVLEISLAIGFAQTFGLDEAFGEWSCEQELLCAECRDDISDQSAGTRVRRFINLMLKELGT